MRRHSTAHVHALAVPRPAASAWQEWVATILAVGLLFGALLAR